MQPIICRLDQRLWFLVIPCLLMALAFICGPSLDPNAPQERGFILFSALVGCIFLGFVAFMADDLARGEIRADETGLSWRRGFSRRKSVRWDEIEDFYQTTAATIYYVITPRGKIELTHYFIGIGAIIELVPQRAATATARTWEVRGFRPHETWQETLPMWSKAQKWSAPTVSGVLIFAVVLLIILYALDGNSSKPTRGFGPLDIFPLVMGALFFGSIAAGVAWMIAAMWRERRFAYANRAQVLHLNNEGLVFEDKNNSIRARWDEIERVEPIIGPIRLRGYRIITHGGEFSLWRLSNDQKMLAQFRARCEHYAPAALSDLRPDEAEQQLSAELDPAPISADGAQTFSFRTRGNRLFVGTTIAVLCLAPLLYLIFVYNHAVEEPFAPSWLLFGAGCALAVVTSIILRLWFARTTIIATPDELQLRSPFGGEHNINWRDVEKMGADVWGSWIRVKGRKIYWMRGLAPARVDELRARIEREFARN